MKRFFAFLLLVFGLASCKQTPDFVPNTWLTQAEQDSLMLKILPYCAKLPRGANHENKFEVRFRPYFESQLKDFRFRYLYIAPSDSVHWFLLHRPAPSLYGKKIALGGKLKLNSTGEVTYYEEVFWTFKMSEEQLETKGKLLFELMFSGKDLSPWLPMNSEEEFIEFPDANNFYDAELRRWRYVWDTIPKTVDQPDGTMDSLEPVSDTI